MKKSVVLFLMLLWAAPQFAQEPLPNKEHDMSDMKEHHEADKEIETDMTEHAHGEFMMARDGSGTAWQPDSSPMSMMMFDFSGWHLMLHGNVFVGLDAQTSPRGATQFMSTNWIMGGIGRNLGPGQISARAMFSLEPLTVSGGGYPLLFQTGESYEGVHLRDRQHPHNLFMELALRYKWNLSDELGLDFYVAPVGEPALGPVAFVHRTSARSNPFAPLSHHWLDSTHISFGVITAGIFGKTWKFDGSWFNGREPGENRYAFDVNVPDSYSGRLSYNPTEELSFQGSYGYLNSPEALEPDVGIHRVTSSAAGNMQFWEGSNLASTLIFGMNLPTKGNATAFGLAEFDFDLTRNHTVFGRVEGGTKTGEQLVLAHIVDEKTFGLGAFSLGYAFRFPDIWKFKASVGAVGTVNLAGAELGSYYGDTLQFGGMIFFQLGLASPAM